MASQALLQACQDGKIDELNELIQSAKDLDLNRKDGSGMTPLAYAARNGHVEVVQELISRGSSRQEVLEQGHGQDYPAIVSLLQGEHLERIHQAHQTQSDHSHHTTDGQPQDGSFEQQVLATNGLSNSYQNYYAGGALAGESPSLSQNHYQLGHQRTESGANVPPPELARMIPCRFFPNCRYGDQCYFAHPVMAMTAAALPDGASIPSSMNSPPPPSHMQPVFYQPVSQGYPYPIPYNFYPPMGPPSSMHHPNYPQNEQFASPTNQHDFHQGYNTDIQHSKSANPTITQDQAVPRQDFLSNKEVNSKDESNLTIASEQDVSRNTSTTPPQQDTATPASNEITEEVQIKSAHRRQSFNSFLQYHAIPFQPNGLIPGINTDFMGDMRSTQGFNPNRIGLKSKRGFGGVNGFGKRNYGERPACTFFSNGRCKYGDECRFPHIMADGSDSRSLQAQQRSFHEANNFTSAPRAATNEGLSASIPTGPAASRNEGKQQATGLSKDSSVNQNNETTSTISTQAGQANGNSNGIVRSNPSKTSRQSEANANNSRNHHQSNGHGTSSFSGNKKHNNASQQPAQRIPTVNDFPALTSASPNLGTNQGEFNQTHRIGQIKGQLNGSGNESESSHIVSDGPGDRSDVKNGNKALVKANFSAILSAPAPVRARAPSAERNHDSNGDAPTPDVEEMTSGESPCSGNEQLQQKMQPAKNPNGNGTIVKENKIKGRDLPVKNHKAESFKALAIVTPARTIGSQEEEEEDDDDFQLVNRSRGLAKKNSGTQHHRPASTSDGFAAQAKAVAA